MFPLLPFCPRGLDGKMISRELKVTHKRPTTITSKPRAPKSREPNDMVPNSEAKHHGEREHRKTALPARRGYFLRGPSDHKARDVMLS